MTLLRAEDSLNDHEAAFDSPKLIWLLGEDRTGIEQAPSEAQWLNEWIKRVAGIA